MERFRLALPRLIDYYHFGCIRKLQQQPKLLSSFIAKYNSIHALKRKNIINFTL